MQDPSAFHVLPEEGYFWCTKPFFCKDSSGNKKKKFISDGENREEFNQTDFQENLQKSFLNETSTREEMLFNIKKEISSLDEEISEL